MNGVSYAETHDVSGTGPGQSPAPAHLASWDEAQARFADILGVDALPEAVLRRAVLDSNFAHRLLVSRNAPKFLAALIADPVNARFAPPPGAVAPSARQPDPGAQAAAPASNLALLGRAATSLARWGATGFTHVDDATYARRLAACASCPHARQAPDTLAYRLTAGKTDAGVCGLCGCPIKRKARMSTESCPAVHAEKPGFTRWDDAMNQ